MVLAPPTDPTVEERMKPVAQQNMAGAKTNRCAASIWIIVGLTVSGAARAGAVRGGFVIRSALRRAAIGLGSDVVCPEVGSQPKVPRSNDRAR
jgi:hypothetical protein